MNYSNLSLLVDDVHALAVLEATSEAMPIDNTRTASRVAPWRSDDTDPQTITAVCPSTVAGGIVLRAHNLTPDAVVSVTLKFADATVDEFTIDPNGTDTWDAWFDPVEIDEYEIEIDDGDNPDGHIDIVQILVAPALTVRYNFELGLRHIWHEDITHRYTAGQSLRSEGTGLVRRETTLKLKHVHEDDRDLLVEALLKHGQGKVLHLSCYPGRGGRLESDHAYVAKRVTPIDTTQWGQQLWETPISFKEA